MILIDTLDIIASSIIPEGKHKYLHVNSREAWVNLVIELIKNSSVKPTNRMLAILSNNWEYLLIKKYSTLN